MNNLKYLQLNPWQWNHNYQIADAVLRRRFVFDKLLEAFDNRLLVSLEGPRRLGKSTLVMQVIAQLLHRRVSPKNIHYYEFSETDNDLESFLKNLTMSEGNEPVYICLDEVQYCVGWQRQLKLYYDHYPYLHLLITGSTSLFWRESRESLLGRLMPIELGFVTFREYMYLRYCRSLPAYDFSNPDAGLDVVKNVDMGVLNEYLQYGEVPAVWKLNSGSRLKDDYLEKSMLDLFFNKDMALFGVGKSREIRILYYALAQNCAQILNKSLMSTELQISRPTINKYIDILTVTHMANLIDNYYRSVRKRQGANKKVFLSSVNLLLSVLNAGGYEQIFFDDFKGHVFENAVYNQLCQYFPQIYFWNRSPLEVDFLVEYNGRYLPIEVKKTSQADAVKVKNLVKTMDKLKVNESWVIFSGEDEVREVDKKRIYYVNIGRL